MRRLLVLVALALPAVAFGEEPGDDVQDFVFFSDSRPVLIRLHVRIDGKPYGSAWDRYVSELFNYLDRDHDGVLGRDEAGRAPSGTQLQNMRAQGYTYGIGGAATYATFGELDFDEDDEVTFEEFVQYYRNTGAAGLQVANATGRAASADPLTDALFRLLDRDQDGKLSRAELEQALKVLRPYDTNDTELVGATDLLPGGYGPSSGAAAGMMTKPTRPGSPDNSAFFLITPDSSPNRLTQRLGLAQKVLNHYDRDKNGRVDRTEVGLDREVFKELDLNKDGELDAVELMKLLRRPPDIEAVIRLGKNKSDQAPTDLVTGDDGKPRALANTVRVSTSGTLVINLGDAQLDLRRADGSGGDENQVADQSARIRDAYIARIKMADEKEKGYVDKKDLEKPQFRQFAVLLQLADADGDERLTEAELMSWFELQSKALGSYVSLAVAENGRGLFDILDTNRDGSLGLRELRTAWQRLSLYDRDFDGAISRAEIPRQYQLTVALGQPVLTQRPVAQPGYGTPTGATAVTTRGPVWFRKMDRNGDGDVSVREFLGTRAEFEAIDTDKDGLISVEEAERYDLARRKPGS